MTKAEWQENEHYKVPSCHRMFRPFVFSCVWQAAAGAPASAETKDSWLLCTASKHFTFLKASGRRQQLKSSK